jgi:hypothetical protein
LFFLTILLWIVIVRLSGTDVKWPKSGGGLEFDWIGYWLDLSRFQLGSSQRRADWLVRFVTDLLDFRAAIGFPPRQLGEWISPRKSSNGIGPFSVPYSLGPAPYRVARIWSYR